MGELFYSKTCPFSTKVLVFLAEANLLSQISLVDVPDRNALADLSKKSGVDHAKVPCFLTSEGEYVFESDVIVERLAKENGIAVRSLRVYDIFQHNMLKDYLEMNKSLHKAVKTTADSDSTAWFKLLDTDGDGNVSLDELLDGLDATRYLSEAKRGFQIPNSKWDHAAHQVEMLIEARPKLPAAHRLKMVLATISDSYDMLFEAADHLLELEPNDPQGLLLKAVYSRSFSHMQEYQECLSNLEDAAPSIAVALTNLVQQVAAEWDTDINFSVPTSSEGTLSILALGSPANEDGSPQPRLLGTLNKTLEVANAFPQADVFVTGAAVSTSMPEAIAMKQWLTERGVDASRIVLEMKARDTVGNYVNIAPMLKERGVSKVILTTVQYHINRSTVLARAVFNQQGLPDLEVVPVAGHGDLEGDALEERMVTERAASYRDLARALHLYDSSDFQTTCKGLTAGSDK